MLESSLPAGTELAVRLGAFLSVCALMAAWEWAARYSGVISMPFKEQIS